MDRNLDGVVAGYGGEGQGCALATGTGRLEWTCAGHLPPLLLRGRKVVAELGNEPIVPFGLRGATRRSAPSTWNPVTRSCCTRTA